MSTAQAFNDININIFSTHERKNKYLEEKTNKRCYFSTKITKKEDLEEFKPLRLTKILIDIIFSFTKQKKVRNTHETFRNQRSN